MTMGTASTMTGIAEACGLTLPGASSIPAVDSNHIRMASRMRPARGRHGLGRPHAGQGSEPRSFENAIAVAMAMGCSTNAIIHLVAMSRRAGEHCAVGLDDFDAASRKVPVIANIRPSGDSAT
jgi:dihydroxyacid dehydratase/phosphogluconate dehydratase